MRFVLPFLIAPDIAERAVIKHDRHQPDIVLHRAREFLDAKQKAAIADLMSEVRRIAAVNQNGGSRQFLANKRTLGRR